MRIAIDSKQAEYLLNQYESAINITYKDAIEMGVNYIDMKPSHFVLLVNFDQNTGKSDKQIRSDKQAKLAL